MYQFNANTSQIVSGNYTISTEHKGAVLAIGNFDGVHVGHQFILNQARQIAGELGDNVPFGAISFSPHPRAFFNPSGQFFRLTDNIARAELFTALGVDLLVDLEFSQQLASLSAEDFVKNILVDMLGIAHVIVGEDFYFGKSRQGDAKFLKDMGEKYGFGVSVLAQIENNAEIISSSVIRQALRDGDVQRANELLGHNWYLYGAVVEGKRLGRTIGFPTANIATRADCELKQGTYAAQIEIDGKLYQGAGNYGTRPTVNGIGARFEIFIFDFDQDIYGKQVKIYLHKYIRGDEKFDGLDALITAIDKDVTQIKQYFAKNSAEPKQMRKLI
ncbi:MAG: bifunctional riboflavin kinase/FAD synthetase [Hyphomicrobiales bacterium]